MIDCYMFKTKHILCLLMISSLFNYLNTNVTKPLPNYIWQLTKSDALVKQDFIPVSARLYLK